MIDIQSINPYQDDFGNTISTPTSLQGRVQFYGKNNSLVIAKGAKIKSLLIRFAADNSKVVIGRGNIASSDQLQATMVLGADSTIQIGDDLTCTGLVFMSASEGTSIIIGDDCMFATGVSIRSDDSHPIFDVITGKRINPSRSISIGSHVWLADRCSILAGTHIGDGSVVGLGSITKAKFPNNCIIAGIPGKVKKVNIAWERPHLSYSKPWFKPNDQSIKKSQYWNESDPT